jgi:outer membrane protein assembly factor BamB
MKGKKIITNAAMVCCLVWASLVLAGDNDWPQWRGPNRDGISNETGILKSWPETGPKVLWRAQVGTGFSGMAVAGGRLATMFAERGEEFVVCYDAATGKEIWRFKSDAAFPSEFGDGPRSTPAIAGDRVFTLGANGMLFACNLSDGKVVWQHNLREEYNAAIPQHGISTSPILEGDLILVNAGGANNHAFIAFNKKDGKLAWASHFDNPDYSAPIAVTVGGVRQVVFFTGSSLVSVSPKDGEIFWKYPFPPQAFNAATPVFVPDNKIFISSGAEKGAALLEITGVDNKPAVKPIWESKVMRNDFSSSVLVGDHIYGFDRTMLKCINVATQEEKWAQRGYQNGTLIFADGHLIVLGERGKLGLVEANPNEFKEVATAQALRGRCWTVPALSDGRLYLRNQKEMLCLDLSGK